MNESNVINDNEDTFYFSSNNFSSNDVDKSILKLTSQMKQNFISAKKDFDKYIQTNLSGKPKTSTHDSITAKESQIKEILKESNETVNLTNQEFET